MKKRRFAGLLAGLVLFLGVLGSYLGAASVPVYGMGVLSGLDFVLEYYLGSSGALSGENQDVNTISRYFVEWIEDNITLSSWTEEQLKAADAYRQLMTDDIQFGSAVFVTSDMWDLWLLYRASEKYKDSMEEVGLIAPSTYTFEVPANTRMDYCFTYLYSANKYTPYSLTCRPFIVDAACRVCLFYYKSQTYILWIADVPASVRYGVSGAASDNPISLDNAMEECVTVGYQAPRAFTQRSGAEFYYVSTNLCTELPSDFTAFSYNFPYLGAFTSIVEAADAAVGYVPPVDVPAKEGYGGTGADVDFSDTSLTIPEDGTSISDRVTAAKEADPEITKEDVDAIVNDAIASGITKEPDVPPDDGSVLGLLSSILAAVLSVYNAIGGIPSNIVSSITLALRTVSELPWFKSVTGFLSSLDLNLSTFLDLWKSNIKHISDAIDQNLPGLADLLRRLADGIDNWQTKWAEQIAVIDNWCKTITDGITGVVTAVNGKFQDLEGWLAGLGDGITAGLGSFADTVSGAFSDVIDNIGTLADALSDIKTDILSLPDVLIDFFTIDVPAVKVAATGIANVWPEKFSFMEDMHKTLDAIQVPDTYEYPVIKMPTPPILSDFYPEEYIILINFGDFAEYFLMVRGIVRAIIWFGFGLYVIRHHMKVTFTV
jgi:hypothetical protein